MNRRMIGTSLFIAAMILFNANLPVHSLDSNWADSETSFTKAEYIKLFCISHLQHLITVEKLEVHFIPNRSSRDAVLYLVIPVVIPEDDLPIKADLGKSLSKKTEIYKKKALKILSDATIIKRWPGANIKNNLIIHFIDSHKRTRTKGAYIDGKTSFDPEELKSMKAQIEAKVGKYYAK